MILTITPNPTLERMVFIPRLMVNRTLRVSNRMLTPSGKGVDVSLVLSALGEATCALGFVAGAGGRLLDQMLHAQDIATDFTWTDGETRMNVIIIGQEDHTHTTLADDTLVITPAHEQALIETFTRQLAQATCVTMGGSMPRTASVDLYARLIALARERQLPVILDASGAAMPQWLAAGPTWIKPNREELEALSGQSIASINEAVVAARALYQRWHVNVLASLDVDGAIAIYDDCAWRIHPLSVPIASPAGAGDAMVAGLASALAHRQPIEHGLRLGTAAAAATVMQQVTGAVDIADVHRLLPQVQLERI